MDLTDELLRGSRLALARILTQIENDTQQGRQALDVLFPHGGKAHLIGVTGAPGTGKSSLVNQLAAAFRRGQAGGPRRVGIVAVDPSSPFTGGAILGDRVRMRDLAGDTGVFIRSMASRGSLGGLALATSGIVLALDAAGYEIIMIETVGAGQAEVDIARLAHTTLVVEAPGLGDDIQAIKAGILEIADVLVINKADRPGVESTERALRSMLQLAHPSRRIFQDTSFKAGHRPAIEIPENTAQSLGEAANESVWIPPIQRTVAIEGIGIDEVVQEIERHRQYLEESGELEKREWARLKSELDLLVRETLVKQWSARVSSSQYDAIVQSLALREISPQQAVKKMLGDD